MRPSIQWHKYPDEKPKESGGYYLVTFINRKGKLDVHVLFYVGDYTGFVANDNVVKAWAYMPEPYGEKE